MCGAAATAAIKLIPGLHQRVSRPLSPGGCPIWKRTARARRQKPAVHVHNTAELRLYAVPRGVSKGRVEVVWTTSWFEPGDAVEVDDILAHRVRLRVLLVQRQRFGRECFRENR